MKSKIGNYLKPKLKKEKELLNCYIYIETYNIKNISDSLIIRYRK